MTTYPIQFGTNSKGTIITNGTGNMELKTFKPNFKYKEIADEGYTVAVSQPLQNETTSQNSINGGTFIEQATYQGTLELPTAPDLTYQDTSITMNMTLPGTQFELANLNGISYLNTVQKKENGTYTFGSANPNNANSIILEVKYTAAQWNARIQQRNTSQ